MHIHKIKLSFLFLIILPLNFLFSQDKKDSTLLSFENGITSVVTNNNNESQFACSYSGNNSITKNKFSFNTTSNYSLFYNNSLINNDLLQKTNLSYSRFFVSNVFNYSLSRKIQSDNSIGIGLGYKKIYKAFYFGISYALMYSKTDYFLKPTTELARHSLRLKFKINTKILNINTEYYYQPNCISFKDYIIYGNTKIIFYPKNKLNFIIQNALNFRSLSNIKMINSVTFGISYNFDKILK
jgi:hypothetical protein